MSLPAHWFVHDDSEVIEISDPAALWADPVVSVYMATYNHAPYVVQAIEGVLSQKTRFPIELIIGEDCSTDDTRAIVEDWQRRRPDVIRIVTGPANVGPRRNSYRALPKARGRYIAFCEGDDYWCDPDKLQLQVDMMEADPELGCVHTDFSETVQSGGKWEIRYSEGVHKRLDGGRRMAGDMFSCAFSEHPSRLCTVLYRSDVISALLESSFEYLKYTAGETVLLAFCAAQWQIGYLDRVTAIYRITEGSLSRMKWKARLQVALNRRQLYDDFKKVYGGRSDFDRAGEEAVNSHVAAVAFRAGDWVAFNTAIERLKRVGSSRLRKPAMRLRRLIVATPLLLPLALRLLALRDRAIAA